MATATVEQLPKAAIKLTITIPHDELLPHLEEAAKRISEKVKIDGFRPGHASLEVVKEKVGEMALYEESLETAIRTTYTQAILQHNLNTVGSPKIDLVKLAPGNDVIYTAEVSRLPEVKTLGDFHKLSIKPQAKEVPEHDIDMAVKDLQRMRTVENRKEAGAVAEGTDKVVLSVNMKKGGVGVEGGQSPNHGVYLAEEYYIPGFKEQLTGMKEGDQKTFTLAFPKEHALASLAGHDVDFEVTMKEIFKLETPPIDDAFASKLGMPDVASLRNRIKENMTAEHVQEEAARQEREALEAVAKVSTFEDIPDLLINEEINKMIGELQARVEEQGADFMGYLKSINKTLAQLKIEFTQQALMRIKVALVLRAIGTQEKIEVTDDELDGELDKLAEQYGKDPETKKRIYAPDYREYMESVLSNRKVVALLLKEMVKA